jgi:hypothetical protein
MTITNGCEALCTKMEIKRRIMTGCEHHGFEKEVAITFWPSCAIGHPR